MERDSRDNPNLTESHADENSSHDGEVHSHMEHQNEADGELSDHNEQPGQVEHENQLLEGVGDGVPDADNKKQAIRAKLKAYRSNLNRDFDATYPCEEHWLDYDEPIRRHIESLKTFAETTDNASVLRSQMNEAPKRFERITPLFEQFNEIHNAVLVTTYRITKFLAGNQNQLEHYRQFHEQIHSKVIGITERLKERNQKPAIENDRFQTERVSSEVPDAGDTCVICKTAYVVDEDVNVLPCLHRFHTECIRGWFQDHFTCPKCRYLCV